MNEDRAEAASPRPLTYLDMSALDRGVIYARDRHAELADRDMGARSAEILRQRGELDPEGKPGHALLAEHQPLAAEDWLEKIAAGEVMARYYRHPSDVHSAVLAGATWKQVAAATGSSEAEARDAYRQWAEGQHNLYRDYEGHLRLAYWGLDDDEYAAALARSQEPGPAARSCERGLPDREREAGR